MFYNGGGLGTRRGLKRSISPDHLSIQVRFPSDEHVSNKENHIKRCQSEMIFSKHSSSNVTTKKSDRAWCADHQLWKNLLTRTMDVRYRCEENFLNAHPMLSTKMRSVLFDWLVEVCEVYHLHRETYHLSIAYIDQYLCRTKNLAKQKFQLLGITALFVAAKIEEIYPPPLSDFTYVTDNTCVEEEILQMELDLMNALDWFISPVTAISWLLVYLQVQCEFERTSMKMHPLKKRRITPSVTEILRSSILTDVHRSKTFLELFADAAKLLDLCSLDIDCCQFPKHILAATAISCYQSDWPVQQLTGLTESDVDICRQWMSPFYQILCKKMPSSSVASSASVPSDELYSIQMHQISVHLLDDVYQIRPKFVPSKMASRPFQDLLNQIVWLPPLIDQSKFEDELIISV